MLSSYVNHSQRGCFAFLENNGNSEGIREAVKYLDVFQENWF